MTPSCENLCLDVGEPDFRGFLRSLDRGLKIDSLQTLAHSLGLSGIFKRLSISVERMTWQEWARKIFMAENRLLCNTKVFFGGCQ